MSRSRLSDQAKWAFLAALLTGALIGSVYYSWRQNEVNANEPIISPLPDSSPVNRPVSVDEVGIQPVSYGRVSFYNNDYCVKHNPRCITASGEKFDENLLTAACPAHIRLGSRLRVSFKEASVVVRCNDRGSFSQRYGRVADLSQAAFAKLADVSAGVISVKLEVLE